MGEDEAQLWQYLDAEGAQHGPVTADELQALAAQGIIHPETEVWTEGLDQWVPATHVEGLLPPRDPEPHHPTLLTGSLMPQTAAHPVEPVHPNPIAAQAGTEVESAGGEGSYPPTPTKRASFGKLLTFLILGVVFLAGGPLAVAVTSPSSPGSPDQLSMAAQALLTIGVGGGLALILVAKILALIYLHRAWGLLQWGAPRTTPGKAVGFLFIPFFNLYWNFVAHYGLAKDWDRIMSSYPELQTGPRLSGGLALAACICMVIPPVGGILLLVYYAQICRGINFMAERAMHQMRAGGIHLY